MLFHTTSLQVRVQRSIGMQQLVLDAAARSRCFGEINMKYSVILVLLTGACIVDHSSHSRTSNIDKGGKQFGAPTTMLSNFPKRKILKPQTYQV